MRARQDTVTFEEFFRRRRTRGDLVVTFLALLELTRVGLMRVYQDPGWMTGRMEHGLPGEPCASTPRNGAMSREEEEEL
jgi:hypothetical protein